MSSRPKILAVVGPCPFAQAAGAQLRVKHVLELLQRCGPVSLVLASMGMPEPEALRKTAEVYDLKASFRLDDWPVGFAGRLDRELNPRTLNTHGFRMSTVDRERVLGLVEDCDLVWFHNVRLPNALGVYKLNKPTVLDADDLMSRYHASAAQGATGVGRLLQQRQSWQWRRRERLFLERFDVVAVCSEGDKKYLGGSDRIQVVPNGYEAIKGPALRKRMGAPTIGFVGSLKYPANREGVVWFLKEVWPNVQKRVPNARFRLAGEGSEELAREFGVGVEGVGWVEDIASEMAYWWLTIVPVHVGGGTRVKIATAFSLECPVVSTTWGAYGYEVTSGKELMLSDGSPGFADACVKLLQDEALAKDLARNAREAFEKNWSWDAIAPRVKAAVEKALKSGKRKAESEK